eukprot:gene30150-39347_t
MMDEVSGILDSESSSNANVYGDASASYFSSGEGLSSDSEDEMRGWGVELELNLGAGGSRSRTWDGKEDAMLLSYQEEYGNKWKAIGQLINRPGSQCFQRYQILRVHKENGRLKWSDGEYGRLFQLVQSHGPRWTVIGKLLGRTAYVCRSAYKRLVDKFDSSASLQMPRARVLKKKPKHFPLSKPILLSSADSPSYAVANSSRLHKEDNVSVLLSESANEPKSENVQRLWTKEEDEYLQSLISTYGRKWTIIAEEMKRSPEDVMLRFDFRIRKQNKAGSWTKAEDAQLLNLFNKLGPKWALVGAAIGRTGAQCSLRYRLTLDPKLKWRLWSPLEDKQLVALREENGYNWAMIAATIDRAAPSCRYRYLKLKREKDRSKNSDVSEIISDLEFVSL